jgi:triosephosphate isomerase
MKFSPLSLLALVGSASAFAPTFGVPRTTSLEATRKPFITGNWKLNPQTREEAVTLASEIASAIGPDSPDADVALFVPYVFIEAAMGSVGNKLSVGAEVSMT